MNARLNILAIGNSVVDCLHSSDLVSRVEMESGGAISASAFLKALPEILPPGILPQAPRAGDAIFVPIEALEVAAQRYLDASGVAPVSHTGEALPRIAGAYDIEAGGSLANTFAAIAWSKREGEPLANCTYLCVQDENEAGQVFAASMPQGVVQGPAYGKCLRCHVIPMDGDRVMITAPSFEKATDHFDISGAIARSITDTTDIVMFEGFLAFGRHFTAAAEAVLEGIVKFGNPEGTGRAQLVLTASSQPIADKPEYREFVKRAMATTDVTIHANTGEFRRLLGNDVAWRNRFDEAAGHPFAGLSGSDLEAAKRSNPAYRQAKSDANHDTMANVALPLIREHARHGRKIRFVVTDGKNAAYIVDGKGWRAYMPQPVDPAQIVNKVGAGDAFMAGFWTGRLLQGGLGTSMQCADAFARAAIMQAPARLPAHMHGNRLQGPAAILNGLAPH